MLEHLDRQKLLEWLNHPVTKEVFGALRKERLEWSRSLEKGDTLSETANRTCQATALAVGVIQGLDMILEDIYTITVS